MSRALPRTAPTGSAIWSSGSVELEADCDIGALGEGSTLGGIETGPSAEMAAGEGAGDGTGQDAASGGDADMPQLAVSEEADFERAKAELDAGNFAAAAEQFATFQRSYPGGPLTARAGLMRGEALEKSGQLKEAARAYLDSVQRRSGRTRRAQGAVAAGLGAGTAGAGRTGLRDAE